MGCGCPPDAPAHFHASPAICCLPRRPPPLNARLTGVANSGHRLRRSRRLPSRRVCHRCAWILAAAGQHERAMDLAAMIAPQSRSDAYCRIAIALLGADAETADIAAAEAIAAAVSYARESGNHYPLHGIVQEFHKKGTPQWALRALATVQAEGPHPARDDYLAVEILAMWAILTLPARQRCAFRTSILKSLAFRNIVVGSLVRSDRIQDAISAVEAVADERGGLLEDIAAISAEREDAATTMSVIMSLSGDRRQWAVAKVCEVWARAGRVEDALAAMQVIEDHDRRMNAMRALATGLAKGGHAESAISVLREAAADRDTEYAVAELAKTAANAGDIDGGLLIAATMGDDYPRRSAVAHVASAAASAGELRRAIAIVRVIGKEHEEDTAFAAVAKELAASDHVDDAVLLST